MKSQSLFLLIGLLLSNILIGQTRYGIKAGINMSDQSKKINPPGFPVEKTDTRPLPGFQIGAFLKYKIDQKFSLAAEANFSTQGSKTKYTRIDYVINPDGTISGSTTGYYHDKIKQIDIPFFVQYRIKQFYLGAGPAIGIKISSKIDKYQNHSFNSTFYKLIDISASSIVGYSMQKNIDIAVKYNYGLMDADKREFSKIENRLANFSVLFNL